MFGDFDIIVAHVYFFTKQCANVSCNYHFCEEHYSASVNKIFSDLCLRYVFACAPCAAF